MVCSEWKRNRLYLYEPSKYFIVNDNSIMGRLTKIYFPTLYKFVNLRDYLNFQLSLKQTTNKSLMITGQIGLNSVLLPLLIITMIMRALHSLVIVRSSKEDHLTYRGHLEN